jgi:hypothetical protein
MYSKAWRVIFLDDGGIMYSQQALMQSISRRGHSVQSGKALDDPGNSAAILDRGSFFKPTVRRTANVKGGNHKPQSVTGP